MHDNRFFVILQKIQTENSLQNNSREKIYFRMIKKYMRLICISVLTFVALNASAQHTVLKTNALYWATATPNLALETKLGGRWTLDMSVGYNPFTFSDNKKWKHVAVQPEARYWLCAPYAGHFFGLHAVYSHYNAGNVKLPFGIFKDLKDYRFQGNLGAIGIGYGYSWMLPGNHWSIEAEVGLGIGVTKYDKYECATCGSKVDHVTKTLLMPTKLSVAIVYNIK